LSGAGDVTGDADVETYALGDLGRNFSLGSSGQSAIGGTGNDTIDSSNLAALTGTLDGGTGTNTFIAADTVDITELAAFSNFQTIKVEGGEVLTANAAQVSGLSVVNLGAGSGTLNIEQTTFNASTDLSGVFTTGLTFGGTTSDELTVDDGLTLTIRQTHLASMAGIVDGAGTANVYVTEVDNSIDFAEIAVDGTVTARLIDGNVDALDSSFLSVVDVFEVQDGRTFSLDAVIASGKTITGEAGVLGTEGASISVGNVDATDAAENDGAGNGFADAVYDFSNISAGVQGAGTAAGVFSVVVGISQRLNSLTALGTATVALESGAALTLSLSQLTLPSSTTARAVTGTGTLVVNGGLTGTLSTNLAAINTDGVALLLNGDVTFNGTFSMNDVVTVNTDTNATVRSFNISSATGLPASFSLDDDVTLTLTNSQADGLAVTGAGSVVITGLTGAVTADYEDVDVATRLVLAGNTTFTGTFDPAAQVTVDGGFTLDITGAGPTNHPGSVVLSNNAVLKLTAEQADTLVVSGIGSVVVTSLSAIDTSNFSNIGTPLTIQLEAASNVVFLGTLHAAQPLTIAGAAELDIVGVTDRPTSIALTDSATVVKLSAAQASGLSVTGGGAAIITDIHSTLDVDLDGVVPSAGVTVLLSADAELTSAAAFGNESLTVTGAFTLNLTNVTLENFGLGNNALSIESGSTVFVTKAQIAREEGAPWATIQGSGTLKLSDASLTVAALLSLDTATTVIVNAAGLTTLTGSAAEFDSLILATTESRIVLPADIHVTVTGSATVAQMMAIDTLNGTGTLSYSLSDTGANLVPFGSASSYLNGAANIEATNNVTAAQAVAILGATNSGATTYNISDNAVNVAGTTDAARNGATNINVTDQANVAQAVTIFNATNSGLTVYSVTDQVATLQAALGTSIQVEALQAARFVTANPGATTTAIDMSGFNGVNQVNLTINGNSLGNSIDGGAGNDIINALGGDDFVYGGLGNDRINGGLGRDTIFISTTLALNGSDTLIDFSVGDSILINFANTGELLQEDLRGAGTDYQELASGEALGANTGLAVVTDVQSGLTASVARNIADGLQDTEDGDQFYLVFGNGTDTVLYRVSDADANVANGFETAELLATFVGITDPAMTFSATSFIDFG
jgi:hypothetical protein